MELSQMKYFKAVAETENMSKAASKLFISQPALSRSIKQLEESLGVTLFDRYGKSIVLNDCGRVVLRYTNQMLECMNNMQAEMADYIENANPAVFLSMNISTKLLTEILPDFRAAHPEIRINFAQNDNSSPDVDDYDICINCSPSEVQAPHTVTVLKERLLLALPLTHPLANRESIALREVADEPFIQLKGKDLSELTENCFRQVGVFPKTVLQCDMPGPLMDFVGLGLGISIVPEITWFGAQGPQKQNIALRPITDLSIARYISVSWRQTTYLSKNAKTFRDYLLQYFAQHYPNGQLPPEPCAQRVPEAKNTAL